jgi:hypothetical protein
MENEDVLSAAAGLEQNEKIAARKLGLPRQHCPKGWRGSLQADPIILGAWRLRARKCRHLQPFTGP